MAFGDKRKKNKQKEEQKDPQEESEVEEKGNSYRSSDKENIDDGKSQLEENPTDSATKDSSQKSPQSPNVECSHQGSSRHDSSDEEKRQLTIEHKEQHDEKEAKTEHQNNAVKHEDDDNKVMKPKSANKKYGFRLTPDEQELAYELKASMMRKLDEQNANLGAELTVQRNMRSLRRQQQERAYNAGGVAAGNGLSQHNHKLLMRVYEKRAKDSEDRIKKLEKELTDSQDLARRYHDMYITERDKSSGNNSAQEHSQNKSKSERAKSDTSLSNQSTEKDKKSNQDERKSASGNARSKSASTRATSSKSRGKVTDDDLDDDEALFKRHVARIVESKSMRSTTPIRVEDVIRKNEVLIQENEALKRDVQKLKWENSQLVKKFKQSATDKDKLLHEISTSEAARQDLSKRLEKQNQQNQKLSRSMTRQTADWIQFRKELLEVDDRRKLAMLGPVYPGDGGAEERTYSHPSKKNIYHPRNIPVEHWASANQ